MENFSAMNVIHGKTQLNEPVHNFYLGELFSFGLLLPNMESQIAMLAIFHYNDQNSFFNERVLV